MGITLVPNVTLMPQDKSNACWYFCAKMMSKWAADNNKTAIKDPSTINDSRGNLQTLYETNAGYSQGTCAELATRLGGLKALPREKRGFEDFKKLIANGPIWAAGAKGGATGSYHVVVIAGVADTGLYFYDPLPLNVGKKIWRTWDWLDGYFALSDASIDKNLLVPA